MTIFTLLPFVVMTVMGAPHVKPSNWVQVDWSAVQWVPFINILFWWVLLGRGGCCQGRVGAAVASWMLPH